LKKPLQNRLAIDTQVLGPRGGLIFCKTEMAKKINSAVFPRNQGGPLMHVIAGKAVAAEEACTEEYKEYISNVILNTYTMCEQFKKMGYEIVSGGTDNHLFMIDLTNTHPNVTGKMVQDALEEKGIAVNKNCVPGDKRSPAETSGIRIGCAAMTTKGFGPLDFVGCAIEIDKIIRKLNKK
jgi:glycine hydroxymethyltransferase